MVLTQSQPLVSGVLYCTLVYCTVPGDVHHGGEGGLSGRAGPRLAVEPVLAVGEVAGGQPGHPAQRGQGNLRRKSINR